MAWITKGNPVVCDFMAQAADEIVIPIIDAVSEALETPVETLPPLSDVIDVDGLETLITESQAHDVTVTFVYAGLRVLVHSDGTVYVRPLQGTRIGLGNETTDSNG